MQLKFQADFPVEELGVPTLTTSHSDSAHNDPIHGAADVYIISLEGAFSLSVWSCKHKCFIEQYTLAAQVHLNQDQRIIEMIEQVFDE